MKRFRILAVLGLVLVPAIAVAGFGDKPKPPVSGAPVWSQPKDSKAVEKAKEKSVKIYIEGLREVEEAMGCLYRCENLKNISAQDPESGEKSVEMSADAQKHLKVAQAKFLQVTSLDPTNADGWDMLGYTYLKTDDLNAALDAFAKALALNPDHFGARENRAEARLAEGRIDDARAELEWLKQQGNKTTLETNDLQTAINLWTAAHEAKGTESGKL